MFWHNLNNLRLSIFAFILCLCAVTANSQENKNNFSANISNNKSQSIESQLVQITQLLKSNQLRQALNVTDDLLKTSPQFQAGWVIRGDILNAMSGSLSNSSTMQKNFLAYRDEIIKRIENLQKFQEQKEQINYPVLFSPDTKYWLFSDLLNSRIYIILNKGATQTVVDSFYVSQGYNGADKIRAGDNRTPIGVYQITSFINKDKLEDFYGNGAYPISYPNNFDLSLGKTGSGIWIHGVPQNLFSRPPLATNGCLALANENIDKLSQYINLGNTFIVNANFSPFAEFKNEKILIDDLLTSFEKWRKDWQSLNTDRYLMHYSEDFRSDGGMNYKKWAEYKKQVNQGKSQILVKVNKINVLRYPAKETLFWVSFDQDYNSNNFSHSSAKEQIWRVQNGQWQIIYEGAKSIGR